jgi:hypothetical protein
MLDSAQAYRQSQKFSLATAPEIRFAPDFEPGIDLIATDQYVLTSERQ